MCGICGFVSKQDISLNQLKEMNDTMYHRGPDDSGAEIFSMNSQYNVGMAQRRLSILDLSSLGHQPMHSSNGRVSVVFNGEIYNYLELKKELREYDFQSNCDTEVIIAAYLKWGIACVDKFNGMFAIALWDRETNEFYLVRDRVGKKPLYYWHKNGDLVFASELKPIMKCPGFSKNLREDVIGRYMYHQYINHPESIFEDVYKLEPGTILLYRDGYINVKKYWDIKQVYQAQKGLCTLPYKEAKEELKNRLKKAVSKRMIADVPLGTFLSGGYDSSLITAMAQESQELPVNTFSIGFEEEKYNEAIYAKEVATYLGTNHTELYIAENEMLDLVSSIPEFFDEPFADSSQIPSMLVAKLAKKDVTVVLSGDGGDEFFCGYNVYSAVKRAQQLDFAGKILASGINILGSKKIKLTEKLPLGAKILIANRDNKSKTQIGSPYYFDAISDIMLQEGMPIKYQNEDRYQEKNWQMRRMLLDMDTYLPSDILCKVDRATMKYSLEARCPILDYEVMEYAFSLPLEYKIKGGEKKRILKDIAHEYIPRHLLERPKKGFSVPLDKWLRGALKTQLLDLSNGEFIRRQSVFDEDNLRKLLNMYLNEGDKGAQSGRNFSKIIWSYFMFQMWYQKYIEKG